MRFPQGRVSDSHLPQKNLAVELLRKLLNNEIKTRSRRNIVKSKLFSEMLDGTIRKYQNRAVQTAQVIEEFDSSRETDARRVGQGRGTRTVGRRGCFLRCP